MHDMAVDIGKAEIATGVAVGQVFVINPHEVKDGSMEIVDVDFVFHCCEAELVGGTVGHASFDSAPCEPD